MDEESVQVRQADFEAALSNLTPSLSQDELHRYDALQRQLAVKPKQQQQHQT